MEDIIGRVDKDLKELGELGISYNECWRKIKRIEDKLAEIEEEKNKIETMKEYEYLLLEQIKKDVQKVNDRIIKDYYKELNY